MALFKLKIPHFIDGAYLEADTVVGTGTPYPVSKPSLEMEGVDEEGKKLVEERQKAAGYLEKALPVKMKDTK